jgi:hypothetical protein
MTKNPTKKREKKERKRAEAISRNEKYAALSKEEKMKINPNKKIKDL